MCKQRHHDCTMYEKWFYFLLYKFTFIWKNGVSEKIKAHLPQHYDNCSVLHLFNFIQKNCFLSQDFPSTLRSVFSNCFWRTFFVAHKKRIFLNMSAKFVLKNQEFCQNAGKPLKNFLAACNSSKILVFHNFFSQVSDNCILRTSISQQKPKGAYYAEFYEFKTN